MNARHYAQNFTDPTPQPMYDESSGEPWYTSDVAVMTTNPPDLILAPANRVSHVSQLTPAETGPPNLQHFQSGHTSIVPTNPAAEQGIGRAPGWQWAHYPHVQQFNDTILSESYLQDGQGFHAFSERVQRSPIWPEGYLHYTQFPDQHQLWPEVATVNQPETPAFVENVPSLR